MDGHKVEESKKFPDEEEELRRRVCLVRSEDMRRKGGFSIAPTVGPCSSVGSTYNLAKSPLMRRMA